MQKRLNDLRNPAQSFPAHGGLAASPAQSAQGSTNSSRVIHPAVFESLRDKARNAIWAAASDRSFIQFFENRVPIAGGNLLHLLAQDEKKSQYIFGLDHRDLRWLAISSRGLGHQFFPLLEGTL